MHAGVYFIVLAATAVTVSINIIEFLAFAAVLFIMTLVMLRLYLPAATQVRVSSSCAAAIVQKSELSMFARSQVAAGMPTRPCVFLARAAGPNSSNAYIASVRTHMTELLAMSRASDAW